MTPVCWDSPALAQNSAREYNLKNPGAIAATTETVKV